MLVNIVSTAVAVSLDSDTQRAEGILIGLCVSLSSTTIVLKCLKTSESSTTHGSNLLGILIMQDVALGLMLALLPVLQVRDLNPRAFTPAGRALTRPSGDCLPPPAPPFTRPRRGGWGGGRPEYRSLSAGRWGTTPSHCSRCARAGAASFSTAPAHVHVAAESRVLIGALTPGANPPPLCCQRGAVWSFPWPLTSTCVMCWRTGRRVPLPCHNAAFHSEGGGGR